MPFKPGQSGNPKGRPRAPEIDLVRQAIEATEKEKKKGLWKHLIEQCYVDNTLLAQVTKKFISDKIEVDTGPTPVVILPSQSELEEPPADEKTQNPQ